MEMRGDSPFRGLGGSVGRHKIYFTQRREGAEEERAKLLREHTEIANGILRSEQTLGIRSIHKYTQIEDTNGHK